MLVNNRFKVIKVLGEGAESFVYTVYDTQAEENKKKVYDII